MSDVAPGFALWFTGLPSSGKTTLARAVQAPLQARGLPVVVLDSDALRRQLTPEPTYSEAERDWFYETVGFLAALLAGDGVNVLIAATAPRRAYRHRARARIGRFAEVYVVCAPDVCRERDPKGLWARAARGEIDALPGAGAPYEAPVAPEVRVDTAARSVAEGVALVLAYLAQQAWL